MRYRGWILVLVLVVALGLGGCAEMGPPAGRKTPDARPEVTVRFLDIGQGDAALVQWPGGAALIDGGPEDPDDALLKDLRAFGVRSLDYIIASHPHADHIGGLIDVVRTMPVQRFLDSGFNEGSQVQRRLLKEIQKRDKITFDLARPGETLQLAEGLTLRFFAPPETPITGTESDANNNSIVAMLTYGDTRFLFTGDLQDEGRAALYDTARRVSSNRNPLRADVLKVAHHGSHNGTDDAFMEQVQPEYAVISCGRANRYGHPHREALAALRKAGATLYRTDKQGDVTMRTDGRTITISTERETRATLWTPGRSPTQRSRRDR